MLALSEDLIIAAHICNLYILVSTVSVVTRRESKAERGATSSACGGKHSMNDFGNAIGHGVCRYLVRRSDLCKPIPDARCN